MGSGGGGAVVASDPYYRVVFDVVFNVFFLFGILFLS